ncbi:spermatogenesis- and oogenesis-specific basic helix-loop-helix-containing protein 1 [Physeter macrocephalus]|uniref:Spermatogenesis- and oogenesis-specific basic helix-loop-helix-containing protein 1 n=1 Tax=Physeter macrocephalus TaxID=9755 RepID=A0A2Y9SUJ8_PHYMC|nr:spermatogenesis- and oogenesis-specific basic helix-loop-helix-containing protein 1 [Physeter catodon]|eukprot:XP_023981868.1 spermatogenesis- and oogenesis-specific basic helix-loop-helix-containing protein 1 [Physeter catodon]
MAFRGPASDAGLPGVPGSEGCSGPFLFGTQLCCLDLGQGLGQARAPAVAKGPASSLPRNVLSERERRKRISLSCERLRALLPQFDGRREDMASVLEMSVQFLRLASALVPGWEKQDETWHTWQKDVLQLALASQTPAGALDPGVGTSSVTMQQASPSCAAAAVDDEPPSLVPRSPGLSPSRALRPPLLWSPRSRQPPSPLVSEASQSCLGQAGSPGRGTDKAVMLGARSVSGCDVEDGSSFLLTASPDWWLGSLEGRGSSARSRVPARSSPLDRAEPSFLGDHEPGSQDPPDGPLEPWSSDVSCPSSALRDEVDSIFPDFFAS